MILLSILLVISVFISSLGVAVGIPFLIQKTLRRRTFSSRGKWSFLVLKYSSIVSIIGLAIGVIGPIVLIPEANQGPLLGLLIFGPGGFFCGAALGSFIACGERRRRRGPF